VTLALPKFLDKGEDRAFRRAVRQVNELLPSQDIEEVFRLYRPPESQWVEIAKFLAVQPRLVSALMEAVPYLEQVFGQRRRYLELELDPEGGDPELFGVVLVKEEPEIALQLLSQFDATWFSKATTRYVRRHLNFTVDAEDDQRV